MFKFRITVFAALILCGYGAMSLAAPNVIRYQGRLTSSSGRAITAPTEVTFSFYATESGGDPLTGFSDTKSVTPDGNGIYTALIGEVSPGVEIPAEIFAAETVYLNVSVGGESLNPRMLVTPSAYAVDARTVSGHDISQLQLGQRSFTTAEDIQAGDLVALNLDGQIKKVRFPETGTPIAGIGGYVTFLACTAIDATHFVLAYQEPYSSYSGYAVVATVSGTTVSFGTPAVFVPWLASSSVAVAVSGTDKVLIAYDGVGFEAVVGQLSGDTLTFGDPVTLDARLANNVAAVGLDTDKVLLAYDMSDGVGGQAVVATLAGTVPSFGAPTVFEGPYITLMTAVRVDTGRALVVFGNNWYGGTKVIIATVSEDTVAFGDISYIDGNYGNGASVVMLDANRFFVAWNYAGNQAGIVGTISGNTTTFGEVRQFYTFNASSWPMSAARLTDERVLVVYSDPVYGYTTGLEAILSGDQISYEEPLRLPGSGFAQGAAFGLSSDQVAVILFDGSSIYGFVTRNLVAGLSRYFGVAEQTVGSGASCRVTVSGGVTGQFHGLVPGRSYYATYGGISTVPDSSRSTRAGRALSANSFLVEN